MPLYRWVLEVTDRDGQQTRIMDDHVRPNPEEYEGSAHDFADRRMREWIGARQGDAGLLPRSVRALVWLELDSEGAPAAEAHWES
ncbi:hypothetical protein [Peterkaempfera griseoplana]|uniref:hypothetical protein n=1 Tax=Peterkaempfera griseoplana TaxID=66896 RepID=UPI0006E134DE|nr:hypothetical protein [Peterkaempfera griseoplana]